MTATTTACTVRCGKCERPLRSAKSIAAGYGPVCKAKVDKAAQVVADSPAAGAVAKQLHKAAALVVRPGGIVRRGHLYLALASDGARRYECAPTGECTCLAAANGHRCYHILAATILAAA